MTRKHETGLRRAAALIPTLLLLGAASPQANRGARAQVYSLAGSPEGILFTFERSETSANGQRQVQVVFRDPQGEVAASEEVRYEGGSVIWDQLVQQQVGERYTLTVAGKQALFEIEKDGETSRSHGEWTSDTVTIDELPSFVSDHWAELARGKVVSFRLVALSRARIVGFELRKVETTTLQGRPAVLLRMRAGSFLVRWFAPEIDLIVSADGKDLLESRGPLPVKVRRGGRWQDFEARLAWVDSG